MLSMTLHAAVGIYERQTKVSKKVLALNNALAIGVAIDFWRKTICKHLRDDGKFDIASRLSDELSDFRSEMDHFDRLTTLASATAALFDDCVVKWVESNKNISLRSKLAELAQTRAGSYLVTATALHEQQRLALEKAKPKTTPWNQNNRNYGNRNFVRWADKTADGKPICRHFNRGSCTLRNCKFEHICNICLKGKHPGNRCFQRFDSNAPRPTNQTQTATTKD